MSQEDIRKISHPEQKILTVQLTEDRRTDGHTDKCKSRADPTRGGSAKNLLQIPCFLTQGPKNWLEPASDANIMEYLEKKLTKSSQPPPADEM